MRSLLLLTKKSKNIHLSSRDYIIKPDSPSGVLLLNKPTGITSNRALQISKRLLAASKAGHTGTLDPMAQGLLPICLGEATKFSSTLLGADKNYVATMRLGFISNTGDAEGEIIPIRPIDSKAHKLNFEQAIEILQTFVGRSHQIPPMFSALKRQGKPLYSYAREGVTVSRQAREIIIHQIWIESWSGSEMTLSVRCGSGTYIRTLAEDIGKALGYGGAYLTALSRTGIGPFDLARAYSLEQLEAAPLSSRMQFLIPIDSLLMSIPAIQLDEAEVLKLQQGQRINKDMLQSSLPINTKLRLYNSSNIFLGLGERIDLDTIAPIRLMMPCVS